MATQAMQVGYQLNQVVRKRIEDASGCIKEVGGVGQTKLRGVGRAEWVFVLEGGGLQLEPIAASVGNRNGSVTKAVQDRISGFVELGKRAKIAMEIVNRR
jgi:hypothetical protein